MTKKGNGKNEKKQVVEFSIFAPDADNVYLSGDFNDWNIRKDQMEKSDMGVWEKSIKLPPGTYEYKFIINETWLEDPKTDCCINEFGTYNNLIHVAG